MSEQEKCCGACKYMLHEDLDGFGICSAPIPDATKQAIARNSRFPLSECKITYADRGTDCESFSATPTGESEAGR